MPNLLITVIYGIMIGLALSVDAFMLSLVYSSTFQRKRETLITSSFVGIFHFFMPLLGYFLAFLVFTKINLGNYLEDKVKFIAFIILVLLGIMMLCKKDTNETRNIYKIINKLLFAFSVSIDSFLTGIAFETMDHINIYIASLCFSIVSFTCTFFALNIGIKTKELLLKSNLDYYAGILMILLACLALFI